MELNFTHIDQWNEHRIVLRTKGDVEYIIVDVLEFQHELESQITIATNVVNLLCKHTWEELSRYNEEVVLECIDEFMELFPDRFNEFIEEWK